MYYMHAIHASDLEQISQCAGMADYFVPHILGGLQRILLSMQKQNDWGNCLSFHMCMQHYQKSQCFVDHLHQV